jgi:hypothetical protein
MTVWSPAPSLSARRGTAAVAATFVVMNATAARAVEREHHLGVDLGGSTLVVSGKTSPDVGGSVGAHWAYGLGDAGNLMAEGAWSLVSVGETVTPKTPTTHPSWLGNLDAGVCYVFDVLRWVPYAGVLLGGYALSGGSLRGTKLEPGAAAALGVDYRFTPTLAGGIALREHFLWEAGTYPSFTQVFARFETTWGW